MDHHGFPDHVGDWTWETVQYLVDNEVAENQYLEYKEYLTYPEDRGVEPSRKEWRKDMEKECNSFANASGGILLFGMTDDIDVHPFHLPDHELERSVVQYVKDATPVPEIEVSSPLHDSSGTPDRALVAVRIQEARRKPVATSDSAYYVRVNDQKHPMSREQLESMFIEADRRQQAVRQLEVEISRLKASYEEQLDVLPMTESVPPFEAIDEGAIRDAVRMNTHLFAQDETEGIVVGILEKLDDVGATKQFYREGCENMGRVWCESYRQLNAVTQDGLKSQGKRLLELFVMLEEATQLQPPGNR